MCDATLDSLLRRSLDVSHEVRGRDVDLLVGSGEAAGADAGQTEGHRARLVGVETGGRHEDSLLAVGKQARKGTGSGGQALGVMQAAWKIGRGEVQKGRLLGAGQASSTGAGRCGLTHTTHSSFCSASCFRVCAAQVRAAVYRRLQSFSSSVLRWGLAAEVWLQGGGRAWRAAIFGLGACNPYQHCCLSGSIRAQNPHTFPLYLTCPGATTSAHAAGAAGHCKAGYPKPVTPSLSSNRSTTSYAPPSSFPAHSLPTLPHLRMCSIEWRVRLVQRGLRDRVEAVRQEARKLVERWLSSDCSNDPVQLVQLFEPELHTGQEAGSGGAGQGVVDWAGERWIGPESGG